MQWTSPKLTLASCTGDCAVQRRASRCPSPGPAASLGNPRGTGPSPARSAPSASPPGGPRALVQLPPGQSCLEPPAHVAPGGLLPGAGTPTPSPRGTRTAEAAKVIVRTPAAGGGDRGTPKKPRLDSILSEQHGPFSKCFCFP